ncbi:ParA family protein [Caballeronia sordidicola]|uniref:Chromosome (Plasmid) partitioning protein ParA n=1 Tax=Caballeronia sordidicola TaxID=196367 RepID=A0A242MAA1_CABSO|nr:AAA family ATPase [Caballeronia sordidicola]OTP68228.1 Chromosome (plasmid) partitioning protein ParA [Caballeronia sordidicola]
MTVNDLLVSKVAEIDQSVSIADIRDVVAAQALDMLDQVRATMLEPYPRKHPPTFTGAQIAQLCGIDKQRLKYLTIKLGLPSGTQTGAGRAKVFSLEETQTWVHATSTRTQRPLNARGRVVAFANFKGGVAKTSTAVSIAQKLTLLGRKVLLIDCDPQGSATQLCGYAPDAEIADTDTLLPLIYGDETTLHYAVRETYWKNLDLIPACNTLQDAEYAIPSHIIHDSRYEFWDIVNKGLLPLLETYDIAIIDTPPALSYLTTNVLMAADAIIMPLPPEALDFASSTQFWQMFAEIAGRLPKSESKRYDFLNIFMTKVRPFDAAKGVQGWIRKAYGDRVFPYSVPDSKVQAAALGALSTVYDQKRLDVDADGDTRMTGEQYERLKAPLDALSQFIDDQFVRVWTKETDHE